MGTVSGHDAGGREGFRPNRGGSEQVYRDLQTTSSDLRANWPYDDVLGHPSISSWRDNLQRCGVNPKDFPCAVESLFRQVLKGRDLPDINALVNSYNLISLRNVVPVGGWDMDADEVIELRLTQADEQFMGLGKSEPVPVSANEIAYATDNDLVTRHFVWRQSEHAKITESTQTAFLVAEVLAEVGNDVSEKVERAFADLNAQLGATVETAILRQGTSEWSPN